MLRLLLSLCLAAGMVSAAEPGSDSLKGKKLIEFGWDEPGTAFLRQHIGEMQQAPFDGCVFHADYQASSGAGGSFTWEGWGQRAFAQGELARAFADLQALRWGRLRSSFLRFNTTPGRLDWFDDFSSVLANARLAARLARAGHCAGLLFDTEQYEGPLFNYHKQRDAGSKSWELYARQAHLRGGEVMRAFQDGYPGLKIFLTFGYSLPWRESGAGKRSLAECSYGLLAPFLDGMIEAAHGQSRIIDGFESSYGFKATDSFVQARREVKSDLLPIVQEPDHYEQVVSLGFGIWLDNDWRKQGWNTTNLAANYFVPETFQTSVRAALETADEFVWIYSESPSWWSKEHKPVNLPEAYVAALNRARSRPSR